MDVHLERVEPLVVGEFLDRVEFALCGHIVHEQVEPTELADRVGDDPLALSLVGQVPG